MEQIGRLLDRAEAGAGGLLVLVGPAGAGKTALLEATAGQARRRGFGVLRAAPVRGQPGRLVWAQLLRDPGAPDDLTAGLVSGDVGPLELDSAARHLVSASPRLILVDDIERGGQDAGEMLSVVAARCAAAPTAMIAAAGRTAGAGPRASPARAD
jgi:AAA ATPase domain